MLPNNEIASNMHGYDVQPSGTGHVHRAPNGMDFERVAVSEPAEDRYVIPNTYSINGSNIPQVLIAPRNNWWIVTHVIQIFGIKHQIQNFQ